MQDCVPRKICDAKKGLSTSTFISFISINSFKSLSKGCSKYGKAYFVGCSAWKYTERNKHRYLPIPLNVDEDILTKVMANDGVLPSDIASNLNETCVLVVHPRVALKACRE